MDLAVLTVVSVMFWCGVSVLASSAGTGKLRVGWGRLRTKRRESVKNSKVSKALKGFMLRRKKDVITKDMLESLSYIRNIAILGRAGMISIESLLTELADFSPRLSGAFAEMARCIRTGDEEEAAGVLYRTIGEGWAKDIGVFLCSWEKLPPSELLQSVEIYKSALFEMRCTRLQRRDEMISDLVYFPVVLNCVVVLLNFLYVAYFLQQKEILSLFF